MPNLAKYVVQLEAQTAKYQKELDRANNKLSTFNRKQTGTLKQITIAFKRLAPAVSIIGFGLLVRRSLDVADQMQKLTDRLGGTTEAFSELEFVGKRAGVQFTQLSIGLQRMQRRVAEAAKGFGEAKAALKELDIDARKLASLPIDKQFEVIAQALFEVKGSADKTRLAMKLFDSEGVALLQTMTKGAAGIQELRQRARELGVTLDSQTAAAAVRAKDRLTDFNARVSSAARNITLALVPSLGNAATKLEEFSVGLAAAFLNADPTPFGKEIADLQDELVNLQGGFEVLARQGFSAGNKLFDQFVEDIERTEIALANFKKKSLESFDEVAPAALEKIDFGFDDTEAELKGLDAFIKRFQTVQQSVARNLAELEKFKSALSPEEFKRIGDAIRDELGKGLDSFVKQFETAEQSVSMALAELEKFKDVLSPEDFDRIRLDIRGFDDFIKGFETLEQSVARNLMQLEQFKDELSPEEFERIGQAIKDKLVPALDELAVFADQAARNIFDAFSDFLFDPFADGVDGMLKNFLDTLRRMFANSLTQQIFGLISGGSKKGGGLGGFFRGLLGRATGGPVRAGEAFQVGERGPEVFVPQTAGNIVPGSGLGGNQFFFNTTLNADVGTNVQALIPFMEERDRKLKGEIVDELDRGQFS